MTVMNIISRETGVHYLCDALPRLVLRWVLQSQSEELTHVDGQDWMLIAEAGAGVRTGDVDIATERLYRIRGNQVYLFGNAHVRFHCTSYVHALDFDLGGRDQAQSQRF